ncbi:NACHT domain-containing protein [Pseudomonas yamanorum]|uniref:NACHT domain-containing protein n=1 Tax=Pseudomonas yamanorum TaxID=515393 RepID=A0ABU1CR44_9PSED|nr:NACHT domain-containing protein [Pseudomonas yamanorum]MDR0189743.1 NACHT domain-containing protein [Pseudomonas yamanorum]
MDINKIVPELIKQFSAPIFSGAKNLSRTVVDKLKVNLDLCFTKYIHRHYDKYSKTKTLLYRGQPVNLRDFYVRTDLVAADDTVLSEDDVISYIGLNQRVVVLGSAGSGKSTFCRSVFLDLVEKPIGVFPIFIELRHLNSLAEVNILDYLCEVLTDFEPGFSIEQLEGSLRLGKVLMIFDGFDEVALDKRDSVERELLRISNKYMNVMMLVSSRYDERFDSWEDFYQCEMQPLTLDKSKALIEKLNYDLEVKEKFLRELEENLFDRHTSFAENPLLLTMMLLTYEQFAEIPTKIHLFYEQAFLTLFNKHDSLKSLFRRRSFTNLPIDNFKKVLAAFCALSYAEGKYSFEKSNVIEFIDKAVRLSGIDVQSEAFLNDLLDSVCIMQRDGLELTFTHRSFQEYFTALFLVTFSGERKFELIEKIAFANRGDDVIPMVFDISQDMIEDDFFIPYLEKFFEVVDPFAEEALEKLNSVSHCYRGLTTYEGSGVKDIAFTVHRGNSPHYILDMIQLVYRSRFDFSANPDTPLAELLEKNGGADVDFSELGILGDEAIRLFGESYMCEYIMKEYCSVYGVFQSMKKRQAAKRDDISSLFFD